MNLIYTHYVKNIIIFGKKHFLIFYIIFKIIKFIFIIKLFIKKKNNNKPKKN